MIAADVFAVAWTLFTLFTLLAIAATAFTTPLDGYRWRAEISGADDDLPDADEDDTTYDLAA